MTTALPTILADPSLPTNPSPPSPSHPTTTHDLEAAADISTLPPTAPSTNSRTSTSSHTPSIPWGPTHPCYPHPNPHLPLSSPLTSTTRIIRIPRDWMTHGDLAPQYSNTYPEILEPWVSEQDFRQLAGRVNEGLAEAFSGSWKDTLLGLATGWLWEDLGGDRVGVKKGCREVEAWIEEWNRGREGRSVGEGGVRCWGLRRTGYLSLDIQIPDPCVRVVEREEEERDEAEMATAPGTVR